MLEQVRFGDPLGGSEGCGRVGGEASRVLLQQSYRIHHPHRGWRKTLRLNGCSLVLQEVWREELCLLEQRYCLWTTRHAANQVSSSLLETKSVLFFREDAPTGQGITNPYGQTKYFIEQVLIDVGKAEPVSAICS